MTNPKTDHKIRKTTSNVPPPRPDPRLAPAPEKQTNSTTTMIDALDRLGQKLDEFASLFREQIEVWRPTGPSAVPPTRSGDAVHHGVETPATKRASSVEETPPRDPTAEAGPRREQPQEQRREAAATLPSAPTPQNRPGPEQGRNAAAALPSNGRAAPQPEAPAGDGLVEMAQDARRLADTLAGSGQSWPEQAAGVQQSLESIMAFLENQAATAAPKVDLAGILSRLSDLEEQQQNLQSQFNNNRS